MALHNHSTTSAASSFGVGENGGETNYQILLTLNHWCATGVTVIDNFQDKWSVCFNRGCSSFSSSQKCCEAFIS